ncbi:aspartate/glutamate racemase family protein [Fusibacter bizertensis]|uniref:Aspartate/glutamate racemase family protein n=1 Tax=Fusibacter bizertensis TaxID=1488331 RepID=A0ABT6NCC8_9FIRM|nr:aspartate/glutamate racemase family protein [Fusibacter bizertensis]MDH8678082.1 aspartate/glutamate racemase family protein [Fusibacter bizertensis]
MKKVYLINTINQFMDMIYTPFAVPFLSENPDVEIFNIADDSLLPDTLKEGKLNEKVARRILSYAQAAESNGADCVMVTCTSVNEAAKYARKFVNIPIFNIDEPVAKIAVTTGTKIGILATLPTSPIATLRLLEEEALAQGKKIDATIKVVDGAFDILCNGERELHDQMVSDALKELAKEVDVVVFAQISMSRVVHDDPGVPVLKIGKSGFEEVKRVLQLG